MYLSADPNVGPFKDRFPLVYWILRNITKLFKRCDWNMLIIILLTFWYAMIQYRKGELRWIFFVYMFFKTNYIWILLWYVTFHIQLEIGLYIMSTTLESFNRTFMRLWFYAPFIKIECGSSMHSFQWNYTKSYIWLSLKTSAVKSDERFSKWRKFLLTKSFVYKKALVKIC